eukprot:5040231-Pyramimonas_sp.AAC.1
MPRASEIIAQFPREPFHCLSGGLSDGAPDNDSLQRGAVHVLPCLWSSKSCEYSARALLWAC